jgi:hypothetical protein
MVGIGTEQGDEYEVPDTRLPRRFDKLAVTLQVNALGVVLTPLAQQSWPWRSLSLALLR